MTSRRVSRWILVIIAFAAMAGLLSWLMLRHDVRSLRLADGREFSIVAVTYGTNHAFEQGPPWARLMAQVGSSRLAYRLGYSRSVGPSSATPTLMVWTRWSSGHSNPPPNFASVADRNGVETEPAYADVNLPWRRTEDRLLAWRFANYPRSEGELKIRFYGYDLFRIRARREGEMMVPNPFPLAAPPAPAPDGPVTATDGVVQCTFSQLSVGVPPSRIPLSAKNAIAPWATAELEFRENGLPTSAWTVKRLEAFSATGNYFSNAQLVVNLADGRRIVHFTGAFWTNEPDWKLIAEVARTRDFPPESLWTLRLPTKSFFNRAFHTNVQTSSRGLRQFSLRAGPSSPDVFRPERPELRIASLSIDYTLAAPDLHLDIASAVDDQGRTRVVSHESTPRMGLHQFDLDMTSDAELVDLNFAIHHSRKMEFRVKPVWVSTNIASTFPPSLK